jgi:hypothetical protein
MSLNILVDYSSEDSIRFNISSLSLHGIMSVVGIAASGADVAERLTVMLGNIVKQPSFAVAVELAMSGVLYMWALKASQILFGSLLPRHIQCALAHLRGEGRIKAPWSCGQFGT